MKASLALSMLAVVGCAASTAGPRSTDVVAAPGSSEALFVRIASVLQHPRCMNCHTNVAFPRQGDDRHRHVLLVGRGKDDTGNPGLHCSTCHQTSNQENGVPGAPNWRVAPVAMGWEGLDVPALCEALLDRSKNGGRSPDVLREHLTGDPLVAWGWAPGTDARGQPRRPVPIPRPDFQRVVAEWVETGHRCPAPSANR